ncbi:peptidase inhibitor family I36 protein [Actinomyces slackii]|uniref:Peptidase inhibitor family I36 n=1 Tax=Actinomyces slackii TaxID=52774 RepID=A0A3S4WI10_9ACTO|nr:peptidase inhibitor family I36 protein [Actinomyces slackii]VEG75404.1 Uncharacterised protein [Actinomyces slackii]
MSIRVNIRPRLIGLASAAVLAAGALTAPAAAAPPQSTEQNGICEKNEICLYYGSGNRGSLSDFSVNTFVDDYGDSRDDCYKFISPGAGRGECIKNNAESIVNNSKFDVSVHTSGPVGEFTWMSFDFAPYSSDDFDDELKNYNTTHRLFIAI